MVKKVHYLRYIVEAGHIRPPKRKTLAVSNFPEPKTMKQVQFLRISRLFPQIYSSVRSTR